MSSRRHDLDWMRLIAIGLLHVFHTGMLYVPWDWHVKSPVIATAFEPPMAWLHYWRMPLLFFVSGAGTWFALRKRNHRQYLGERARRLLLPLVVGMFVIVPPQIYFERIDRFDSYWQFWGTVFDFVPYPLDGSFSWHHLWFVLYLFLMSALILPAMAYWRSERAATWRDRAYRVAGSRGGLAWYLLPLLGSQFALRPFFRGFSTGTLIDDWGAFVFYALFFWAGYAAMVDQRLWQLIGARRRAHLVLAIASLVPFYAARYITYPYHFFGFDFLYYGAAGIVAWFTVLAVLGYGQRYLQRPSPVLHYANDALYPFYILHQTAIIVLAWYVMPVVPDVATGFVTVFFLSAAASLGIYHFLVRPFAPVRVMFGLHPRPRGVDAPARGEGHLRQSPLTEG